MPCKKNREGGVHVHTGVCRGVCVCALVYVYAHIYVYIGTYIYIHRDKYSILIEGRIWTVGSSANFRSLRSAWKRMLLCPLWTVATAFGETRHGAVGAATITGIMVPDAPNIAGASYITYTSKSCGQLGHTRARRLVALRP